jgi:serine/threonine protein kinase
MDNITLCDLFKDVTKLDQGGMGAVYKGVLDPEASGYRDFLASVIAWAEIKNELDNPTTEFGKLGQKVEAAHQQLMRIKGKAQPKPIEVSLSVNNHLNSAKELRKAQFMYVKERIAELIEAQKSDQSTIKEIIEYAGELGRPIPDNSLFAIKQALIVENDDENNLDNVNRLRQEFTSLNVLNHKNIIKEYMFGKDFYTMEFIEGFDLSAIRKLKESCGYTVDDFVLIAIDIGNALINAHKKGIIHRDVKPSNIKINEEGMATLIDWGISKSVNYGTMHTMTGAFIGTPQYMSPQQIMAEDPCPSFDIYSLGATLYEITTCIPPYSIFYDASGKRNNIGSSNPGAIAVAATSPEKKILRPSQCIPDFDRKLETIILKAMEKESNNRFGSMEEFVSALQSYMGGHSVGSITYNDKGPIEIQSLPVSTKSSKTKSKLPLVAGLTAGVLTLGGLGIYLLGGNNNRDVPIQSANHIATPVVSTTTIPPVVDTFNQELEQITSEYNTLLRSLDEEEVVSFKQKYEAFRDENKGKVSLNISKLDELLDKYSKADELISQARELYNSSDDARYFLKIKEKQEETQKLLSGTENVYKYRSRINAFNFDFDSRPKLNINFGDHVELDYLKQFLDVSGDISEGYFDGEVTFKGLVSFSGEQTINGKKVSVIGFYDSNLNNMYINGEKHNNNKFKGRLNTLVIK